MIAEPGTVAGSTGASPRSVLVVVAAFPPWGGGAVLRITKLVKYLAVIGWEITVISSDEAKPDVVDQSLVAEIPSTVRVIRVRGLFRVFGRAARGIAVGSARRRPLARIAALGRVVLRAFILPDWWVGWAWRVSRLPLEELGAPSLILSSGPPHSAHLAGSALARRLRRPHVIDLRDDWAGGPFRRHPAPWHGAIDRLLERRTLSRAARIVTIYDTSRRALAARYPTLRDRITSIPNGYDPDDFAGLPARVPSRLGSPVRFLYAGTLGSTQDVGRFFEVFGRIVRDSPSQARLRLLGFFSARHEAIARAAMPAWAITIDAPVSHLKALEAMAESDVLVVFTAEGGAAGADTLTGKLYEYLAIRRPILLIGPNGAASDLVSASGAGVVAEAGDADALDRAIRDAVGMARTSSFEGAPDDLLRRFDRRALAEIYAGLLQRASVVESQGIG